MNEKYKKAAEQGDNDELANDWRSQESINTKVDE